MNAHLKAIKLLKSEGFSLKRKAAKHDIYYNEKYKIMIPLKRHDFNENDLRYIEKEIALGKINERSKQ